MLNRFFVRVYEITNQYSSRFCVDLFYFRVAVVTGGNKGIGLEVCRQLASRGVMVILTARDERKGSEAVGMLHGSGLPDVEFRRLDVSDPTDTACLAEFIKEKFGRLDILVRYFFRNIRIDLIIWSMLSPMKKLHTSTLFRTSPATLSK